MDYVPRPTGRLWKSKADFFRPFRSAAATAGENIEPLYDPSLKHSEPKEVEVEELNFALEVLVEVFPDVEIEGLREMLVNVSPESRVELVAEGLLKRKGKVGRSRDLGGREKGKGRMVAAVEREEMFRSEGYKKAVKQVLYAEFRNLSHSTIRGVLAERNFSYAAARPVLQQVASRSWRFSISSFWSRKPNVGAGAEEHPFVVWRSGIDGVATPSIKKTGSEELDRELYYLFVEPIVTKQKQDRLQADFDVAAEINEQEAEEAEALFDCECCFGSVPFENIATCDDGCHYLCLDCIRRTVNEALYGQGWARTADLYRSTVRCFAPTSTSCNGCIPAHMVKRSLTQGTNNEDTWHDFQSRIATETLLKSGLPLQRCPFCNYAESNELPRPRLKSPLAIWQHLTTKAPPAFQILFLSLLSALSIFTVPLLCFAAAFYLLAQTLPSVRQPLENSFKRVQKSRLPHRFTCQNPVCGSVTCTLCSGPWRPGHICFESERTSLRTALESSATAAIKRTCPRCMLSFIKSSGCNKLVCNCGYTMCYVCRQEISLKEGYAHFCQHFRPNGGVCGECERCDLYGDEDEGEAVRRAVEGAEREWRERGGEKGDDDGGEGRKRMLEVIAGSRTRGKLEGWMDGIVDVLIA